MPLVIFQSPLKAKRGGTYLLTGLLTASGVGTPNALIRCCMVGEGLAPPFEPVSYLTGSITTR